MKINCYFLSHPVIAKRRIGHTAEEVRDFILATDLDGLLPEYCELLLKFIPTKEEVRKTVPVCVLFTSPYE